MILYFYFAPTRDISTALSGQRYGPGITHFCYVLCTVNQYFLFFSYSQLNIIPSCKVEKASNQVWVISNVNFEVGNKTGNKFMSVPYT